jgi:hypothetical protein
MHLNSDNQLRRRIKRTVLLLALGLSFLICKALADQFQVKANPGRYRGMSETATVFPQFEIRVVTADASFSDKQPLDIYGEALFDVEPSNVKKLEWTTSSLPKYVLWPPSVEATGQKPLPNPCARFELYSLKGLWNEQKTEVADNVRKGRFDDADKIFRAVDEVYEPYRDDPKLASDLSKFIHQLYESMVDKASAFRGSRDFAQLSPEQRGKFLDDERGWHRSMIARYKNISDEGVNRRLAEALRKWSDFARSIHCRAEWPNDSINTAKGKQSSTLLGDLSRLHDDLVVVADALISPAVTSGLGDRIQRNLNTSLSPEERRQLSSYADLIAEHQKQNFNVDDIQLDSIDKAISAFQYFHHP